MRARASIGVFLTALAATLAILALPSTASAAKVANPGPFNASVTGGFLRIKDKTFSFDGSNPITFAGTIDSQGNVNIPTSGQSFPAMPISAGGFDLTVRINPAQAITGTVNPLTGEANLRLRVWIKIDGVPLGGGCRIASASSPIDVNALITGTTSPPGPNGPISGAPYNPGPGAGEGTMKIVNNNFSVPSSSDCGLAASTVNGELGLPSNAGNNEAQFDLSLNPVIRRGITAALNVSGTSGLKPYTVDFDASASTRTAALRHYQWDFDGNGTFDRTTSGPTTSFTYNTAGVYNAKVRHIDVDGDFADATRTITVIEPPDVSIDSTHSDPFRVGTNGTYNLSVKNNSVGPTTGQVTVTDTLPAGIVPVSASGAGWVCNIAAQLVTCTRSSIAGNTTAPNIAITANVTAASLPGGSNIANVTTAADSNAANNTDTDATNVTAIDLEIEKSHDASFRPGTDPANVWTIDVENAGTAATVGTTTVTDTLPAGFAPVSASGTGWTCNIVAQTVTCTRAGSIAVGAAPPIEIQADVTIPSGETSLTATNTASVATAGDAFASNDSDSDETLAIDSPDAAIEKSHTGNLTAGTNATYTLAIDNVGPQSTSGTTTVSDTLPTGLTFVSASGTGWNCSNTGQDVTCDHADPIAADGSAEDIELVVAVGLDAIPSVTNTATVSTPGDDNPANDSSSDPAIVRAIDLDIDKTHAEPFRVGREGTYDLDVANIGDSDTVSSATVTDTLPAGLTFVSATGAGWSCNNAGQDVTCTHAAAIAAGDSADTIELVVDVGAAAIPSVSNTASVATTDDYNPANNSATDETAIVEVDAGVSISRTGGFHSESTGTYLLAVDNDGVTPTTGPTTLTATLPTGLNFVSADGAGWSCSEDAGVVTCEYADPIPAESSVPDVQLRVSIDRDAPDSVTTTAEVSTADDRNPDNDSASDTTSVTGPDLAVASTHTGDFHVGGTGTYKLGVSNGGVEATRGTTTVTDTLPAGMSFDSASGAGWDCSEAAGVVTCTRTNEIAAGSSAPDITLGVKVAPAAAPSGINEVKVETIGDRDPDNDTDSDLTNVKMIDLRLDLERDGAAVVGSEVDYQVAVDNVGDAPTVGPARVTDTLPIGITPTEADGGTAWSCEIQGQTVKCDHNASLAPSEQAAGLTITATVSANAADTSVNSATVSTTDDGNPANDSDSDSAGIVRTPDLSVTIDDQLPQSGALRVGGEVGYKLTVLNQGGSPTTSASVLDIELAEGLEFISADRAECTGSGRLVACTFPAGIAAGDRIDLNVQAAVTDGADDEAITNVSISTDDDPDPSDDTGTVTSPVTRTDLLITKQYGEPWTAGRRATYAIGVENLGDAPTAGPVTVRDELPTGISFASAQGFGWTCRGTGDEVVCEQENTMPGGGLLPLEITVDVGDSAVPGVSGEATVETRDDVDLSNNTVSDSVDVLERPEDREAGKIPAALAMKRARPTSNGIVYIRLLCPQEAENGCTGAISLSTVKKVKTGSGKRKRVSFGNAAYDITQGHTQPVGIRLSNKHRTLLKKLGEVKAQVVITPTGLEPISAGLRLRSR